MSSTDSKKLVAIVGIICLLAGFGIGWFAKPAPPQQATLTIIGPWSGDELKNFLPVLNAFTNKTGIPVQYKMIYEDGNWQVFDLVLEGISLVRNYRSSYGEIIRRSGYDGLLTLMDEKVEEMNTIK